MNSKSLVRGYQEYCMTWEEEVIRKICRRLSTNKIIFSCDSNMTAIECFLCLDLKEDLVNCIKIGSSEWNKQHVKSVLEKHMWPMSSIKSKSPWLCSTCWEMIHDFHDFYKRIKDSHEYYDYLVKFENDMDIDEYEVNDFLPDVMVRQPDALLDEANMSMDDNNDSNTDDDIISSHSREIVENPEIKLHIIQNKLDVVQPETVIINDTLPENCTLQLRTENKDEQLENPLDFSATNEDDAATDELRKQFLAKYYRFTCNICQDPCTTFAMLQQHFREVHNQEAYMICCGKKYTNRNIFGDHIKLHLDPDCFKCKFCSKILKNKRNLVHHIARWHEGNIFRCNMCNKKFLEKSKYDEHKSEHREMLLDSGDDGDHNDNGDDEYLRTADKRPTSSCYSELENEIESNSSLMEKSHQTATNDKEAFPTPHKYRIGDEHFIESSSNDSENFHEAENDNKTSTPKSEEKYQGSNHLTIQGYLSKTSKFKCDICQEPTESFGELQQHFAEDHADQKPYVICCGAKFRSRNVLSEHVKSHLIPDCYKCQYCSKVLKNKRNFRAHIIRWHEEKTFPCDKCDKRFINKSEYEEHKLVTHLSETKIFEREGEVYYTKCSVKKSDTISPTAEIEQVFGDDVSIGNEDETEGITSKDTTLSEDGISIIHITNDEMSEMSREVAVQECDTSLEDSAKAEAKTEKIFATEIQSERSASRNRTTPLVLMQFDRFLRKHHKFTCHLCDNPDETYENFVTLRQHFTAEHKIEGYVFCCGAKFKRRRCLVDHIKGHLDPDYFKCTYCSRVLRGRRGLQHHVALHEGNVKRCKVCNKKFYDAIKYENHTLTHIPRKSIGEDDDEDDNRAENSDDSDDDIPLIYSIVQREAKQEIAEEAESTQQAPDYSKNLLRQLEHDEFLAKHFKIICPICEDPFKTFETFALLREHFASEHEEEPYLICCAKKFKKRDILVQHIKTHLNPYDFTCKFCSKILKSKRNLLYHIAACHEGKQFRCDICQKKFVEESSYKYHIKTHKPNDNPHFPCPECGRSYKIKHKLTHHINTSHRHRYARLCDICGGYFRDSNLYSAHMKSKHQESGEKESYPCDVCGRILAAKASLRLHKRTQHPENGAFSYTCHICSKPVATKGLLNYHIRMTHKKNKPHKCAVCGKAYKEAKELKGHMGIHTGESLYKCNFCPKTFNSTGNRSTHRKKCHPKEWKEWNSKFYVTKTTTHNSTENS